MNPLLRHILAKKRGATSFDDRSLKKYPGNASAPTELVCHDFTVRIGNPQMHEMINVIEAFYRENGIDITASECVEDGEESSSTVTMHSPATTLPFKVSIRGSTLSVASLG